MVDAKKHQVLNLFHIVMINVIAVDSIRTLPFSAEYGLSLIFYYVIAIIMFFIPSALVSAELGTGWPHTGGLYIWIREAFGHKVGLIIIWLNWIYNLAWYPTIMTLIAGVCAYIFNPELAENKLYITTVILILFWSSTYLSCHGMKVSSLISSIGATIGTLIPMASIILLCATYLLFGHQSQTPLSWKELLPSIDALDKLAYFSNVLFGLIGLEMVATHAQEMKHPQKDYPKALCLSVFIITISIILSSLAIAVIVPHNKLNLVTGILQAFSIILKTFNMPFLIPLVAICIILGSLSCVSAWIIGPTKGIMVASKDGCLPKFFTKTNKHNVPTGALFLQAIIVTFLCLVFTLMPTVNASFWMLSIITAQLAMIVYIVLFAASIKLHYHKKEVSRSFKIPGGSIGIWVTALLGISISLFSIIAGFMPPKNIQIDNILFYEFFLIFGMLILISIPMILYKINAKCKK